LIDRSGELLLEASIEYRFGVIKNFLESALFLDAGNIWNLSVVGVSNPDYGVFNRHTFLSEVALNTGIGFRFDVEIFMFRVDWGIPIRDPSKPLDERWVMKQIPSTGLANWTFKETAVAIGIGYPF
jgi:outer membrane protein assembly factor BamA